MVELLMHCISSGHALKPSFEVQLAISCLYWVFLNSWLLNNYVFLVICNNYFKSSILHSPIWHNNTFLLHLPFINTGENKIEGSCQLSGTGTDIGPQYCCCKWLMMYKFICFFKKVELTSYVVDSVVDTIRHKQ